MVTMVIWPACQADDVDVVVQGSGDFFTYTTTSHEIEICEGNIVYAERWMRGVAAQLGIDPDGLLPTTYQLFDPDEVSPCGSHSACTRQVGDHVEVYSTQTLHLHELVHAVQFSEWPSQRALLTEGLAMVYDDQGQSQLHWQPISSAHLDELIEASIDDATDEVYFVGGYIVYWLIERHGAAELESFWLADAASGSSSAAEFRETFEAHFGESLDEMIAAVQLYGPACVIPTCVDDLVEWQGDRWTFDSPRTCGGSVRGRVEGDDVRLEQTALVEITTAGSYQVSVSAGEPTQGIRIAPCSVWCGGDDWLNVKAGEVDEFVSSPGATESIRSSSMPTILG